jgi:hypothetical protein
MPGRYFHEKIITDANCIGGLMGLRAGLGVIERRKSLGLSFSAAGVTVISLRCNLHLV